jgi:hypothetical protein
VDIDDEALAMAERNAAAVLGPGAVPSRVALLRADFAGLASADIRRTLHPGGCA